MLQPCWASGEPCTSDVSSVSNVPLKSLATCAGGAEKIDQLPEENCQRVNASEPLTSRTLLVVRGDESGDCVAKEVSEL